MKGLYRFQRYLSFITPIWLILSIVSLMFFLSSYAHFLLGQTEESLTETRCQKMYYSNEGW